MNQILKRLIVVIEGIAEFFYCPHWIKLEAILGFFSGDMITFQFVMLIEIGFAIFFAVFVFYVSFFKQVCENTNITKFACRRNYVFSN